MSTGALTLDQAAAAAKHATPETDAEIARIAVGRAPSEIARVARTLVPPMSHRASNPHPPVAVETPTARPRANQPTAPPTPGNRADPPTGRREAVTTDRRTRLRHPC